MVSRRSFIKICASALMGINLSKVLLELPTANGAGNRQIPILAYHRVGYTTDNFTVTPERLTRDLDTLQQYGYCTISLEQLQRFLTENSVDMPDKPVVITFDDGYIDNYENAYPILKNHNMIATFFVITGLLWTPGRLDPSCIVEMSQNGMSFGSHTVTHRSLGTLTWGEIHNELLVSKTVLESVLGKTVNAIAYPQGSYNENVITLAKNLGYITGFSVLEGSCYKDSPDFELRRIPIFKYDNSIVSVMGNRGGIYFA